MSDDTQLLDDMRETLEISRQALTEAQVVLQQRDELLSALRDLLTGIDNPTSGRFEIAAPRARELVAQIDAANAPKPAISPRAAWPFPGDDKR